MIRRVLSFLLAFGSFASAAIGQSIPAFLDSETKVTAWFATPIKPTPATCYVMVGDKKVAVTQVDVSNPMHESDRARDPEMVSFPGTIQSAVGGSEWSPADSSTKATKVGPNRYEWVGKLPAGEFLYKVAKGGSWDVNYGQNFQPGGANIALKIPAGGAIVKIVVDFGEHWIKDSINNPSEITAPVTLPKVDPIPANGPCVAKFQIAEPISPKDITKNMFLHIGSDAPRRIFAREVLSGADYIYEGHDLGVVCTEGSSTFKVWSPVASKVKIQVGTDNTRLVSLVRGEKGVWSITMIGDWHGQKYQYQFYSYGQWHRAPDIYCYAATPDGQSSVAINPNRVALKDWPPLPAPRRSAVDAIIYETHVRDLTVHPSSGVRADWRGKYLGLSQRGTTAPGTAQKTALDYLVNLGVTDIHLLPFQNFNPGNSKVYNWGYETNLFNMPEEQYATKPDDPIAPIMETKHMVAAMHKANLRVVLDVVYNHTVPSEGPGSAFEQSVPYYYFRTNDQGRNLNESGVGNAMNDERPMARKYIKESLAYWAKEYKIDGFRFDLMGMFVPETMQAIAKKLRAIRPDILIYGEPWTGGGPTRFAKGAQRGLHIGVFNDQIRDAIRGEVDGAGKGFSSGGGNLDQLKLGLVGSIDYSDQLRSFAENPDEAINYVSAHDNMCLVDKLALSVPKDLVPAAVKFAGACVLLSQGVPFLEGGAELGRTKGGSRNSYNLGDSANQFRWDLAPRWQSVQEYYRGLIAVRKGQPLFRLASAQEIRSSMKFLSQSTLPANTIAFTLTGNQTQGWQKILVVLHGSTSAATIKLPDGPWQVAVDGANAKNARLYTVTSELPLKPLSAYVLFK